jgi:hypothetical protein
METAITVPGVTTVATRATAVAPTATRRRSGPRPAPRPGAVTGAKAGGIPVWRIDPPDPAGDMAIGLGRLDGDVRVKEYVYDSGASPGGTHVERILERLADREEPVEYNDVAEGDREAAVREAMFSIRETVRIGDNPDGIYDEEGDLDFSAGVLITEEATGRRGLDVGESALETLREDGREAGDG